MVRALGERRRVLDRPTSRSLHSVPTPRTGGLAILVACVVGIVPFLSSDPQLQAVLAAALAMAAIGGLDDVWGVAAAPRLGAQTVIAIALVAGTGLALPLFGPDRAALSVAVSVFWLIGVTNAYNFMDGIHGIASVEAIVASGALALLAIRHGDGEAAVILVAILGACGGFLPWNFPSGSIFMGDAGSGMLGLAFGALILRVATRPVDLVPATLPLLPFLLDAGATLLRRIWRRENILTPHRSHYYQRLVALGYSHTAVTTVWGSLAVAGAAGALAFDRAGPLARLLIVIGVLAVHVFAALMIARLERSAGHVG
jgi:UDP-GlcNAc:undecaprenyl-phosphate GlcNAc-1-phosphate transferase